MRIEALTESRSSEAIALWHDTGLTRPWNDPRADLRRALDGPASTVLAAIDDDTLLGTAMVGDDGHRCWVYYLAVRPDAQRKGIGRQLMAAAEQWGVARRAPKIQLMVRSASAGVISFYERLGYAVGDVTVLGKFLQP